MSSGNSPTIVIDDTSVHYNTSRDAGQAVAPSSFVSDSVKGAQTSPWNGTLAVITTPISFWYNVTGYSRVAVYGATIPPSNLAVTAWANYTINGNYTAANITTSTHIVTDFPLFTSVELDPNQHYNLTADIWASPDAPYLFDYLLAFSPPNPTPVSTSSTVSSTGTAAPTTAAASSLDSVKVPHPIIIIGALAGACALLLALLLIALCCLCRKRGSKAKTIEEPVGPESPFPSRPTVNKSATLVSARAASRRTESFQEPPLNASSTSLPLAPSLSLVPERPPTPISAPPAPRPATTYVLDHGLMADSSHHRSATMPTAQHHFAPTVPMMFRETAMQDSDVHQRPISPQHHPLPHAASMPRLGMPSGMATPTVLQLPTPFERPPAGEILRPESPLQNPYDALYGHLDAPAAAATTSGTSTSTPTASRSPSASVAPAPLASTSTPSTSAPSASASMSAQPETTTAAAAAALAPSPAPATSNKWGPNEYPPEKREVRLEPPRAQGSASSPDEEHFVDSPPAYSS